MAVRGAVKVKVNTAKVINELQNSTKVALEVGGVYLINKVKPQTPKRFGHLRAAFYKEVGGTKENPILEVGNNQKYAVFVHENLTANFTVGRAKYLQLGVQENLQGFLKVVQRIMRKVAGR